MIFTFSSNSEIYGGRGIMVVTWLCPVFWVPTLTLTKD